MDLHDGSDSLTLRLGGADKKGDILYSVVGSFGKAVYIDFDKLMVFQRHIAILRPKSEVNARYIYYTMTNSQFYKLVDKLAIGCSQRTVTTRHSKKY